MLNGDAHHSLSEAEGELRIRPLLYIFKDSSGRIIPDRAPLFHPMFLPAPRHRILYAGADLDLLNYLKDALKEYFFVRCTSGGIACLLIRSDIPYSLLLMDEKLPDTTGRVLARFTRSLAHRERTPVIIIKKQESYGRLAETIKRLLGS